LCSLSVIMWRGVKPVKKAKTVKVKKSKERGEGVGWASSMASAASLGTPTPGLKHFSPPA
jgi:hypothetical protein